MYRNLPKHKFKRDAFIKKMDYDNLMELYKSMMELKINKVIQVHNIQNTMIKNTFIALVYSRYIFNEQTIYNIISHVIYNNIKVLKRLKFTHTELLFIKSYINSCLSPVRFSCEDHDEIYNFLNNNNSIDFTKKRMWNKGVIVASLNDIIKLNIQFVCNNDWYRQFEFVI